MLPMNKSVVAFLVACAVLLLLSGCGGRSAHPVAVRQYGDENRSCGALEGEQRAIETEISQLLPKTDKTGKNLGFGLLGVIVPVSWFFLDLSDAEQVEIDALRRRYNYLIGLSSDRHCGQERARIPDFRDQGAFQQHQIQMQQLQQQQLQQLQQQQQMQLQQQYQQQLQELRMQQMQLEERIKQSGK
ncbi:MAG: hypothetical protein ACR2PT_11655 [Endozoicomonas sp.]